MVHKLITSSYSQTNLSAEVANVFPVLRYLNFFHHLSEGGTIAGAILAHYSNLLRPLGLTVANNTKGYAYA